MKRIVCDECSQEIEVQREIGGRVPLKVGGSRVSVLASGDWTKPKPTSFRDVCWECIRKELNKQAVAETTEGIMDALGPDG